MTRGAGRRHPCNHRWIDLHDPEALRVFDETCSTALENEGANLDRDAVLAFKAKFWDTIHTQVMEAFEHLKQQQVNIIFVAGNRELLLPRKYNAYWKNQFPFTELIARISW